MSGILPHRVSPSNSRIKFPWFRAGSAVDFGYCAAFSKKNLCLLFGPFVIGFIFTPGPQKYSFGIVRLVNPA